jgi:NTE family protein
VIGTSIGAVNAGLIAGNSPNMRMERVAEFWTRVQREPLAEIAGAASMFGPWVANAMTITCGVRGFFEPNPLAFLGMQVPLGSEHAGYYSTKPLERTLEELIDPAQLNAGQPRLTVGAANVQTGQMRYFDTREMPLTIRHIVASGALPPAFPAIRIGQELFWDGGVLSNTPVEVVFDDSPRRSGLVFAVHMWAPNGPEPDSIGKVLARQKDLQYSSRAATHIARQKQLHRLRHVIMNLAAKLPHDVANLPEVRELASYGCVTRMHIVRLLAPPLAGEDHSKDIDFSPSGIKYRWQAGYSDTSRVLMQAPWTHEFDPLEGLIIHQAESGHMTFEG